MRTGCGILFDGREHRQSDEPKIELTAAALNRLVQDAGVAAQAGLDAIATVAIQSLF